MVHESIYEQISRAIVNLNKDKAIDLAKEAVDKDLDLLEVIEKGYAEGIRRIGELWDEGELFLPELMLGGTIMQEALEILLPKLKSGSKGYTKGKVVIATIEGDIHSIGKTIVGTMLSANGYEVFDLGADVPIDKIIETAMEKKADIIGVSALLTTTMIGQKKLIDVLKEKGLKKDIKVIIGGAPVTNTWVEECDADGYAGNAIDAVKLVKEILESN